MQYKFTMELRASLFDPVCLFASLARMSIRVVLSLIGHLDGSNVITTQPILVAAFTCVVIAAIQWAMEFFPRRIPTSWRTSELAGNSGWVLCIAAYDCHWLVEGFILVEPVATVETVTLRRLDKTLNVYIFPSIPLHYRGAARDRHVSRGGVRWTRQRRALEVKAAGGREAGSPQGLASRSMEPPDRGA